MALEKEGSDIKLAKLDCTVHNRMAGRFKV